MQITVSDALNLLKQIKQRKRDLDELRGRVSVKETWFSTKEKQVEPLYSVQEVDQKVMRLQQMEFELDNAIKKCNAVTTIEINLNLDEIFEPLK